MADDSWRDTYDTWKLRSPDDDCPEDECLHEDYETNSEGRSTCCSCGHRWWLTASELERERILNAEFDEVMRREERRERWRQVRRWFRSLISWRRKPRPIDDEIPF